MNRQPQTHPKSEQVRARGRVLMLVENCSYPDDMRVLMECRSLHDAGYQMTVICPTGRSRRAYENVEGVHVYRYPKPWEPGGFLGYIWEFGYSLVMTFLVSLYVVFRRGCDVLHVRTPPDIYVFLAGFYKLFGKKYVVDLHDLPPEMYQAQNDGSGSRIVHAVLLWFESLTCRTADLFIASSESQRRMQIERGGAPPDRCHIVRNSPHERFLEPIEPIESLREPGKIILGYMGMIGVQDRVDMLVRACQCLKNELGRDDFRAVIVGDGPALDELKRLAVELGIEQRVSFAGFQRGDDLLRHVASFDICVTPDPSNAYNDTCSMVKTMEYMAMAKPVVAFDLRENRITAGDAGFYAKGNDAIDLARQIAVLMDDAELRARLGQAGRQRVVNTLLWSRQQRSLLTAYEKIFAPDYVPQPAAMGEHAR
ncbi:MAG TPA: glycosyltransferase family 4 protein [Lacipirellulaceae bacterium]|jgi:glycosyltransferase involved in cell wall biosynthesis